MKRHELALLVEFQWHTVLILILCHVSLIVEEDSSILNRLEPYQPNCPALLEYNQLKMV